MEAQNQADINEIKTTTKFILKRLDTLVGCGEDCECSSQVEQLRKAVQALEERVSALQLNGIHLQNEETDEQRFTQIQIRIDELRQSLLLLDHKDSKQGKVEQTSSKDEELSRSSNRDATVASFPTKNDEDHMHIRGYPGEASDGAVFHVGEADTYPLNETERLTGSETIERNQSDRSTKNVSRSQMTATSITSNTGPSVIRQIQQDFVYGHGDYWKFLASQQQSEAQQMTKDEESIRTVLCLDISESMASGNAWSQAKTFVNDFLNGLDMILTQFGPIGLKQEYVGLATFGHDTKQQLLATSNYTAVRDKIENLLLGGPSPLFAGLWFSLAGATSCRATEKTESGVLLCQRIIVITDGKPTETGLRGGPDIQTKGDETLMSILSAVQEIEVMGASVFFVGVGDFDEEFLKLVSASEGREKLFGYQDGRRLAKRTYLCTKTNLFDDSSFIRSASVLSEEDNEDMQDIRVESMARLRQREEMNNAAYFENKNEAFPVIGSRVRRGPDWMFDNQDNAGPGTVVGHSENDFKVWVTWDFNKMTGMYRYGMGEYDVLISDEPRVLKAGEKIAVGCRVKPGRDAGSKDVSGSIQGVVIRMNSKNAHVRWDNGKRGDYSYGADGRYEIELCKSNGQTGDDNSNSSTWGSSTRSNKNKNKHVSS